jgi:hypothetical protein
MNVSKKTKLFAPPTSLDRSEIVKDFLDKDGFYDYRKCLTAYDMTIGQLATYLAIRPALIDEFCRSSHAQHRLATAAQFYAFARRVLGDAASVRRWFKTQHVDISAKTPLERELSGAGQTYRLSALDLLVFQMTSELEAAITRLMWIDKTDEREAALAQMSRIELPNGCVFRIAEPGA